MLNRPLRLAAVLAVELAVASALPARAPAQAPAAQPATAAPSAPPAARELPLTAAQRAAYVGTYRVALPQGGAGSVRVFEDGDVLRMHAADEDRTVRLLHRGAHVFHAEGVPDFALTFVLDQGRATRFRAQKADGAIDGTRVQ